MRSCLILILLGVFFTSDASAGLAWLTPQRCSLPYGASPYFALDQFIGDSRFAAAKAEFEAYRDEKSKELSSDLHLPYVLDQGHSAQHSVLLIHGLYESPYYLKGLAKAFHDRGMNVITVVLPGHWTNPPEAMDRVKYQQWRAEVDRGLSIAKKMGKNVLVAGYSTGGLLAVDAAMREPENIKGVFTWAPAMDLSLKSKVGSFVEAALGVPNNVVTGTKPDGKFFPYLSSQAGKEVAALARDVARKEPEKNLKAPLFMVNSDEDRTISASKNLKFYTALRAPKALLQYRKGDGINHNRIAKAPGDEDFAAPAEYNTKFNSMVRMMNDFIDENLQ